jgi:hypothetical protein
LRILRFFLLGVATEAGSFGTIPNRVESVRELVKKLGPVDKSRVYYEAGPTGDAVYWQLVLASRLKKS